MKHGGALRVAILTVSHTALRRFSVPSLPELRLSDTLNTYIISIADHNGQFYGVRVGTSSTPDDVKTP